MSLRVGWGFDVHRFGGDGPMVMAGVIVDVDRGVAATSDGDVAAHAVADAVLGAAVLGDLGSHFPSSDPVWENADSMRLLADVVAMAVAAGWKVQSLDLTVVAQSVKIAPHREAMRRALSSVLGAELGAVSVKATTTDTLGFIGRDEGIAAAAVVTLTAPRE